VLEDGGGIGADGIAVALSDTLQVLDVSKRIGRLLRRQVGWIGHPPTGLGAGVHLHELAAMKDAYELAVGPHLHLPVAFIRL
jgi:hypothetical protein